MTAREEIALQLALKTIEKISFKSYADVKIHPYEIFNSIYENLQTEENSYIQH